MKQFLLFTLLVLCSFYEQPVQAQRNNVWSCGYYLGLDFNGSGTPVTTSDSCSENWDMPAASVSDHCGQLLFYSDGYRVFDRLNRPFPHDTLDPYYISLTAERSAAIASVPGSDSLYYLFYSSTSGSDNWLVYYSLVDMRLNGGYGDIVASAKNILLDSNRTTSIIIAGSCGNQWLLAHHQDSAVFYAYNLNSPAGPGAAVVSRVGKSSGAGYFRLCEIKVSSDFTKIAMALSMTDYFTTGSNLELFDFDNGTGLFSNYQVIDTFDYYKSASIFCVDFSPDGSRLYTGLGYYLMQYDLTAGTAAAIKASQRVIHTVKGYVNSLRRGPDDMLYMIVNEHGFGTIRHFSRIPFPDRAGTTCGYEYIIPPLYDSRYENQFTKFGNYFIEHLSASDTIRQCATYKLCKDSYVLIRSSLPNGHYTWYDGDTVYEKKIYDTGAYWVWSTSACGTIYESIHVVPGSRDTSYGLGLDTAVCEDKSIILHTERVWDHYYWSNGDTGLSTTAMVPDTLLLTATYQCHVRIDTFSIRTKTYDTTLALRLDTTLCVGAFISYTAPPGKLMLRWSDGDTSSSRKIYAPDTLCLYTLKDCIVSADTIRVNGLHSTYDYSSKDTFFCTGTSLNLKGRSPADSFLWSTGNKTVSQTISTASVYWVNSIKKCAHYSDTFRVHEQPYDVQMEHIDTVCCQVTFATITAADGYDRYLWSSGSTAKSTVVSGPGLVAIRVTATDTIACRARNQLYQLDFINFTTDIGDTFLCNGNDTIILDADIGRAAHYQWNTGDTTASISIRSANTYIVSVAAAGCTLTDTIQVLYRPLFLSVGSDTSVCKGQSLTLQASVSQAQYLWSTGATDSFITINQDGHYSLRVVKDGCTSTAATDISFINCDHCIRFPNAFSPNNDGINDYFKPLLSCPPENYELSIYNRWGQQVWHTLSPADTWDGTFKGIPADGNTFFYMLRISFSGQNKAPELYKGEVTLIR